jgi:hypothetical protein
MNLMQSSSPKKRQKNIDQDLPKRKPGRPAIGQNAKSMSFSANSATKRIALILASQRGMNFSQFMVQLILHAAREGWSFDPLRPPVSPVRLPKGISLKLYKQAFTDATIAMAFGQTLPDPIVRRKRGRPRKEKQE